MNSGHQHSKRCVAVFIIIVIVIIIIIAIVTNQNSRNRNNRIYSQPEDEYDSRNNVAEDYRRLLAAGIVKNQPNYKPLNLKHMTAYSSVDPTVSYPIVPYFRKRNTKTGPMVRFNANPNAQNPDTIKFSVNPNNLKFDKMFNRPLNKVMGLNMKVPVGTANPDNGTTLNGNANPTNPTNSRFTLTTSAPTITITPGGVAVSCIVSLVSSGNVTVSLYGSNIPVGVSVSTSSNMLTSTYPHATLTFAASTAARIQNTIIHVLGYSSAHSYQLSINLHITASTPQSSFTLSASPSTLAITQGGTSTSTITINPVAGFNGVVGLAASGLPSGVTASFSSSSTPSSSLLTFAVSSTATTGTNTITITGTSGALNETTTISLTVNTPTPSANFGLYANPTSVTVLNNNSTTTTISVYSINNFSGSVALSMTGLPAGVTASFSPSSVTVSTSNSSSNAVTSILTLTANSSAAIGSTTVTVSGKTLSLTNTINLPLTINGSSSSSGSVTTTQSQNWSGFVSARSLTNPTTNSCTMVAGTFIIPSLNPAVSTTNNNVSAWIGIDGAFNSDPTVQQLGVDLEYAAGQTQIYAWYEMYPANSYSISGFPANVGDEITVSASVSSVTGRTTVYNLTITNVTQNESVTIPTSQTTTTSGLQQSVEWIVEAPAIGNTIVPLSEFTPITWTNCTATINGTTGPISTFQSELINMESSRGTPQDSTSMLNSNGDGFTVTWLSQ